MRAHAPLLLRDRCCCAAHRVWSRGAHSPVTLPSVHHTPYHVVPHVDAVPTHGSPVSQPSLLAQPGPSIASYSAARVCRAVGLDIGGSGGGGGTAGGQLIGGGVDGDGDGDGGDGETVASEHCGWQSE